jgi:hypothetical protein
MNMETILGVIRHILTFGGGFVVAKGWADEATITAAVGAAVTLIGAVWSVLAKRQAPAA